MPNEDNPSSFKNLINESVVRRSAVALKKEWPDFDASGFKQVARTLGPLALKQRVQAIRTALKEALPPSYPRALRILLPAARKGDLGGFALWPFLDFIQTYGLEHPEISMKAMRELTPLFTAEFAVRPFIIKHRTLVFKTLASWTSDRNPHVRRWASEGTRPRLPWGERLRESVEDPSDGLALLEDLRWDEELYVRKSVANHLNDVAKDHPRRVVRLLKTWQKEATTPEQKRRLDWIIRRSLRTLIKNGNAEALALVGVSASSDIEVTGLKIANKKLRITATLEFSFTLSSKAKKPQKVVVDYIIHHMRSAGETTPKVFKLSTTELAAGARREIVKRHALKPISTRRYYSGKHVLEIQLNGRIVARADWDLSV